MVNGFRSKPKSQENTRISFDCASLAISFNIKPKKAIHLIEREFQQAIKPSSKNILTANKVNIRNHLDRNDRLPFAGVARSHSRSKSAYHEEDRRSKKMSSLLAGKIAKTLNSDSNVKENELSKSIFASKDLRNIVETEEVDRIDEPLIAIENEFDGREATCNGRFEKTLVRKKTRISLDKRSKQLEDSSFTPRLNKDILDYS